jgi:hypothetical protein
MFLRRFAVSISGISVMTASAPDLCPRPPIRW